MNRCRSMLLALAAVTLLTALAQAQSKAAPAFDKLKSLAGDWQGKASDGSARVATYRLASGGSAVIETLTPEGEPEMITVYHRDGDRLAMTHYCSAGNQPRMRAEIPAGELKRLDFTFVDVTNLKKPADGHIHGLSIFFQDQDHISLIWTWRQNGQDSSSTIKLERKK